MIYTINDGTLYLRGARTSNLQGKRANYQIPRVTASINNQHNTHPSRSVSSYAVDHGVAFPDLLNTDEGLLNT